MTEEITLESLAGVGPVTTRKLNDAGIHNIMDLVVRGPVEIAELTSMDIETAGKLKATAFNGLARSLGGVPLGAMERYARRKGPEHERVIAKIKAEYW